LALNESFIAGRVRRRLLRSPILEGWHGDERTQGPGKEAAEPLGKVQQGTVGVRIPGGHAELSQAASAIVSANHDLELLIGWPEHLVIIRQRGMLVHAEGDPVHFGTLYLDPRHRVARTGYRYVADTGVEVAVELTMTAAHNRQAIMLGPGERAQCGDYLIEHERSYDPSDRPSAVPHHAYSITITRASPANALPPHPGDVPLPIDIASADPVLRGARARGVLGADEALLAEPEEFAERVRQYEGPQATLEESARSHGPWPAEFRRLGDGVEVVAPRVSRGDGGRAVIGRARVRLFPTGDFEIDREDAVTLPGRMRKTSRVED